jgi:hypothetical protein
VAGRERLNRVEIEVAEGRTVSVPWALRDWLVLKLHGIQGTQSIRDALTAVGASRPVVLMESDRIWLSGYLEGLDTAGMLPVELYGLRDALWPFRTKQRKPPGRPRGTTH